MSNDLNISPSTDMDVELRRAFRDARDLPLAVKLSGGVCKTEGTREWADTNDVQQNRGFRMGASWTLDIAPDSTLQWDYEAVPGAELDEVPNWLCLSTEARFVSTEMTPEACWQEQPQFQAVRGGTIDLQFSKAVERWRKAGKALRIGGVMLAGHCGAIEGVHVIDGGAWGNEGFPLVITGAIGMYDRNLIAQLDPATHIFDHQDARFDLDCAHITHCVFDQHVTPQSNDQVSVYSIWGSVGERTPGQWIQTRRAFWYQRDNTVNVAGSNLVQGHTGYHGLRGSVSDNLTMGANFGAYGDFWSSTGTIYQRNRFLNTQHGMRFVLSPTGPDVTQFSHEQYVIDASNEITSSGPNISLDTMGPSTARRYIKHMAIDNKFSVEVQGDAQVVRFGGGTGCRKRLGL